MAIVSGVLSRYVEQGYVTESYVEGQPVGISASVSATPNLTVDAGSVVSSNTVVVTVADRTIGLDLINYSWDDTSRGKYNWDNWWLTDQTWEQRGLIVRNNLTASATGGITQLGNADLTFDSTVSTTGNANFTGISFSDVLFNTSADGSVIKDFQGLISGQASVTTIGGFLVAGNATVDITSSATINGVTSLFGTVTIRGLTEVTSNGDVNYVGSVSIPATTQIDSSAITSLTGSATIDLGSVIVAIGKSTPFADPFRQIEVPSETRNIQVPQETRTNIVQSESRVIIVPQETRSILVQSETRTIKVPLPPFVSGRTNERESR